MKVILIASLLLIVACAKNPAENEHYKVLWGKRCTESGNQYSYVWFHSVYGEETVRKEWCQK